MSNHELTRRHSMRPTGETLDERYRIGDFSRKLRHCDVYEVEDLHTTAPPRTHGYEARFFKLSGLSRKYGGYRRRAMGRLTGRKIHKTKWNDFEVIIYKTDEPATSVEDGSLDDHREQQGSTDETSRSVNSSRPLQNRIRTVSLLIIMACLSVLTQLRGTITTAEIIVMVLISCVIVACATIATAESLTNLSSYHTQN